MTIFACHYPGYGAIFENTFLAIQHRRDLHVKEKQKIIKVARETMEESTTSKQVHSVATQKSKCDVCNKTFSTAHNVIQHKEVIHSTKVIKCDVC